MVRPHRVSPAKALRRTETEAEQVLWARLRNRHLLGMKFRRQESLGSYVVDFVSFEAKLVIEIDGGQHDQEAAIQRDEQRTAWLQAGGFRVIRFWNNDVRENIDGVVARIGDALGDVTLT